MADPFGFMRPCERNYVFTHTHIWHSNKSPTWKPCRSASSPSLPSGGCGVGAVMAMAVLTAGTRASCGDLPVWPAALQSSLGLWSVPLKGGCLRRLVRTLAPLQGQWGPGRRL